MDEQGYKIPLEEWSIEALLPIEQVREHVGIDDVETVSDELLNLYRQASFEAAEMYTGLSLRKQNVSYQSLKGATSRDFRKGYQVVTLKKPALDGLVHVYGGGTTQLLHTVDDRQEKVRVPMICGNITMSCGNCNSGQSFNAGVQLMYKTGFRCAKDIPVSIKLGMLKYIAWTVKNPGDEIQTMKQSSSIQVSGITGTNEVAFASGAYEIWKQFTNGIF